MGPKAGVAVCMCVHVLACGWVSACEIRCVGLWAQGMPVYSCMGGWLGRLRVWRRALLSLIVQPPNAFRLAASLAFPVDVSTA